MARILVVDDDRDLRTAIRIALELDGHEVRDLETAAGAIAAIDEDPPDLVVSDVYLPGSGLEVLRHARRRDDPIPVVLVTGLPSDEIREAARSRGSTVLTKPIDLRHFRSLVREALTADAT